MSDNFRQDIFNLLTQIPTRKLDGLGELWAELGYDHAHDLISTRQWPPSETDQAELRNVSQTKAQQYLSRELRVLAAQEKDSNLQGQINLLETAFRQPLSTAVKRQINHLRKSKVVGRALLDSLNKIYQDYNLRDSLNRYQTKQTEAELPVVVCSMGLQ